MAVTNEETFVHTNDAGSGFLHRATGRCLIFHTGSNTGFHSTGLCALADPDGDLIFSAFDVHGGGKASPPEAGTIEYVGGTGKYVGLIGHATYTIAGLKKIDKDSPATFEGHAQGTYKLGVKAASTTRQAVIGQGDWH